MQLSSLCYQAASSSRRASISQTGHGGLDSIGGSTAMHSCILHIVLMNKSRVLSICRVGPRQGPRVPQASTTLAAVGSVKGPGSLGSGRGTISHWVWRGGGEHSRSKAKEIDRKSQGKTVLLEGKYWRTKACKNMCILRRCQTKPFTAQHHASFCTSLKREVELPPVGTVYTYQKENHFIFQSASQSWARTTANVTQASQAYSTLHFRSWEGSDGSSNCTAETSTETLLSSFACEGIMVHKCSVHINQNHSSDTPAPIGTELSKS